MITRYTIKVNGATIKSDLNYNDFNGVLIETLHNAENTGDVLQIKTTSETKKEVWHNCGINHNLTNVYDVKRVLVEITRGTL